jgi:hypothetical protein
MPDGGRKLPDRDSNPNSLIQSQVCCHYTIRQKPTDHRCPGAPAGCPAGWARGGEKTLISLPPGAFKTALPWCSIKGEGR